MARIAGINIPMNKHVWVGLTAIYGIGRSQARKACEGAGVKPETKVKDLTEPEVAALRSQISRLAVEAAAACCFLSSDICFQSSSPWDSLGAGPLRPCPEAHST